MHLAVVIGGVPEDDAVATRYGLASGARLPGLSHAASAATAGHGASPFEQREPLFVTGMPLGEQIARQVSATNPTSRAIHFQRLEGEANKFFRPKGLPRRRHW